MKRARLLRACALTGLLALPAEAFAESRDPVAAEALFRQAREALARGDLAEACPKLAESQRLDPGAGTLMNLAECEERQGRLATAWQAWQQAHDQLRRAGDDRQELARAHLSALEPRVPRLVLRLGGVSSGVRVARDDVELGPAAIGAALPVDPGEHRIVVRAPGHADAERKLSVLEGETVEVSLEAGPLDKASPALPAAAPPSNEGAARPGRTLGVAALGVAAFGLTASVLSGLAVVRARDRVDAGCDASGCSTAGRDALDAGRTWLSVNTACWISTGVAAGLGIGLLVWDMKTAKIVIAPASRGAMLVRSW